MRDVHRDTLPCYNSCRLPVIVSEAEIWQSNAAVGEYPVSCCDGKTDLLVFSYSASLKAKLDYEDVKLS